MSEIPNKFEYFRARVPKTKLKLQKIDDIRKQICRNLQNHLTTIQLKYEIEANGANLPRSEDLETVTKKGRICLFDIQRCVKGGGLQPNSSKYMSPFFCNGNVLR